MLRRRMMEQIFESDTGYIGIYTITEPITNDIEISSVLSEFIGSGEIWIKKNMGGPGKTNELLSVIFPNTSSALTDPYWTRVNADGTIRVGNQKANYYMNAAIGDQFYRFKYQE